MLDLTAELNRRLRPSLSFQANSYPRSCGPTAAASSMSCWRGSSSVVSWRQKMASGCQVHLGVGIYGRTIRPTLELRSSRARRSKEPGGRLRSRPPYSRIGLPQELARKRSPGSLGKTPAPGDRLLELRTFSLAALADERNRNEQVRPFRRVRFKHSFRETAQRLQRSRLVAGTTSASAAARPRERRSGARRTARRITSGASRDGPGSQDSDEDLEPRPLLDGATLCFLRAEVDRRRRKQLEGTICGRPRSARGHRKDAAISATELA